MNTSDEITVILTQTSSVALLCRTWGWPPLQKMAWPFQNQAWLPISRTLRSAQLQKEQRQSRVGWYSSVCVCVWGGVLRNLSPMLWRFGPDWTVSARGPGLLKDKCISLFHYSWCEEVGREQGAWGLAQQWIPSRPRQGQGPNCTRCTHTLMQERSSRAGECGRQLWGGRGRWGDNATVCIPTHTHVLKS